MKDRAINEKEILYVYAPIASGLGEVMQAKFDDLEQRAKVTKALVAWLTDKAKKKPVPDLTERLVRWSQRIKNMVQHMKLDFSEGEPVIKVMGSDEQTLKLLQFGSTWFEPNANLMETIWAGLFET